MLARIARVVLACSLTVGLLAGEMAAPASARSNRNERRLHRLVDRARTSRGIHSLRRPRDLHRKARRHSVRMARRGYLYHHRCLSCAVRNHSWSSVGENVAKARTVRAAHRALMRSRTHRRNILCRCYNRVGYGVVKRGGWVWVTQIFIG